jgi:hypothetical protein
MTKNTGRHTAPHIDSSFQFSTAQLRPSLLPPTFLLATAPPSASHADDPVLPNSARRPTSRIDDSTRRVAARYFSARPKPTCHSFASRAHPSDISRPLRTTQSNLCRRPKPSLHTPCRLVCPRLYRTAQHYPADFSRLLAAPRLAASRTTSQLGPSLPATPHPLSTSQAGPSPPSPSQA